MAFKTVEQYNEDKYRNKFVIQSDKESADVVFLYQSYKDMLVADVHYIKDKSGGYSGYVHCCDNGCPVCALRRPDGSQLIRRQIKIFIPVYNISKDAIEFWDRNQKFEQQFKHDVFDICPNPSEYVFKVIRHGLSGDVNTRYEIRAVGRNTVPGMSYAEILAKFNAKFPDYYENIVKSASISELTEILQSTNSNAPAVTQDYIPTPRAGYQSSIPNAYVDASQALGDTNDSASADDPILSEFDDSDVSDDSELPDPTF